MNRTHYIRAEKPLPPPKPTAPTDVIDELTWKIWDWYNTAEPENRTQKQLYELILKWSQDL